MAADCAYVFPTYCSNVLVAQNAVDSLQVVDLPSALAVGAGRRRAGSRAAGENLPMRYRR